MLLQGLRRLTLGTHRCRREQRSIDACIHVARHRGHDDRGCRGLLGAGLQLRLTLFTRRAWLTGLARFAGLAWRTLLLLLALTLLALRRLSALASRLAVARAVVAATTLTFVTAWLLLWLLLLLLGLVVASRLLVAAAAFGAILAPGLVARAALAAAFAAAIATAASVPAIATAVTATTIPVTAVAVTVTIVTRPITVGFERPSATRTVRCRCFRFRRTLVAGDPAPGAHEHVVAWAELRHDDRSDGRRSGDRCGRGRSDLWGRRRGRRARDDRRHRGLLQHRRLLFLGARDRVQVDLGLDGHLMADDGVFRQVHLVVAHAAQFVRWRFQVLVRHQHDVDVAARLDVVQPVALLVHEVGRDVDGQLRDDLGSAVLAGLFADQPQHGECQRFDAADHAHAGAARADDVGRFADRRPQALP